ncbi:MAG: glycosyltransferase family 2 protein [Lachnospiraceae bacterium]|nr:glycosyltransferase family 2 protein [Lachnospiraceae bacterium]
MPEVSVIMAVYNVSDKKILEEAIDSILQQTFDDFELVICDDGSVNDTWNILQELATKDIRIKIIHNEENCKAGYARNTCIQAATGRYILVMDADDISAPKRIEKLYNFLEEHQEYDFVGSKGEFFVEKIGDDGELYWYEKAPQPKDFLFSLPFVHASIMFRKEALDMVSGYNTAKKVIRAEDYDLLLRLYGEGMKGYNLADVLYYIRRDESQYKRRKYRYRFHEAYIKYRGFKKLGLMPKGIIYVVKPLIVGLIPIRLMKVIQKRYYSDKQGEK